jgi:hypothetical protein
MPYPQPKHRPVSLAPLFFAAVFCGIGILIIGN